MASKIDLSYTAQDKDDIFLDKAVNAISAIKVSNSYLKSRLEDSTDKRMTNALRLIEKSVLQIEEFCERMNPSTSSSLELSQKPLTPLRMNTLQLSEILNLAKPRKISKDIKISYPKNDYAVFGHLYKLVVVFSNLIENSIQAMKNNGTISISATETNEYIVIELQDSGPGIPESVQNKMFYSLCSTKSNGNGLGLKMTKTIIDMHKGTISVKNNPTTFTIKLPKAI